MPAIKITAHANIDGVVIAWSISHAIPGCLGFALERKLNDGTITELETEMPFEGQPKPAKGHREPSSVWPIQRFIWTDHSAPLESDLRYRVRPVKGSADAPELAAESEASDWTPAVRCATGSTEGFELYPNLGVAAAPWVERRIEAARNSSPTPKPSVSSVLKTSIETTGNELRNALAGPLLKALRREFDRASEAGEEIFAALYELRDHELRELLIAAGDRVHVILANGAFNAEDPDPNSEAADQLAGEGIDVKRRMVGSGHFAHNKFLVFTKDGVPQRVWTGSTNWTPSGLCTQSNHGVLIEANPVAVGFMEYWKRLQAAGDGYPPALAEGNANPVVHKVGTKLKLRAWCTPVKNHVDLDDARAMIDGAQDGAVFLMFKPGSKDTLVDNLRALHDRNLFIRGIVNAGFAIDASRDTIQFFNKSAKSVHGKPELLLPDHLRKAFGNLGPETAGGAVLIHSKTIVVDPFGKHPIVMTGSHNLGPKASKSNDDNLVIIENAGGLAAEFAVYIMNVYDHYRWRYEKGLREEAAKAAAAASAPPSGNVWKGLKPNASWQNASYLASAQTEMAFWSHS